MDNSPTIISYDPDHQALPQTASVDGLRWLALRPGNPNLWSVEVGHEEGDFSLLLVHNKGAFRAFHLRIGYPLAVEDTLDKALANAIVEITRERDEV